MFVCMASHMSSIFAILMTDFPVQFSTPVLLYFYPLLPEERAILVEKLERPVLLAEPTERDYYTLLIFFNCCPVIVCIKSIMSFLHSLATTFPTLRSLIEYFSHPAFLGPSIFLSTCGRHTP